MYKIVFLKQMLKIYFEKSWYNNKFTRLGYKILDKINKWLGLGLLKFDTTRTQSAYPNWYSRCANGFIYSFCSLIYLIIFLMQNLRENRGIFLGLLKFDITRTLPTNPNI